MRYNPLVEGEEEVPIQEQESLDISQIVPTTDDPRLPSLTFRVLVLGTSWNILLAAANSIFMFRSQVFWIPSTLAVLLSYPMGISLAKFLPSKPIRTLFGFEFTMNPGPFTIKEHMLIYIIASAGSGLAYGVDNVVVQKFQRYMGNSDINLWNSLAFVMSVQLLGFGIAGLARRFLVKPPAMIWPSMLSTVALFVGFHERSDNYSGKYGMSRFHFFWMAAALMFVYSWIPEFFVTALQSVSVLCFIATNPKIRFLASSGFNEGVGLGALTFDWNCSLFILLKM